MDFIFKVITSVKKRTKSLFFDKRYPRDNKSKCKMSVCDQYDHNQLRPQSDGIELKDKAYNICRKFLSGEWNKISSNDMVFKSISGGLSNFLYYCSLPATHTPLNGEPSQVLLRMYGQLHDGSDNVESDPSNDRNSKVTDCVITMLLAERNLGPKLYGIFPGGRLEEYIPARAMHCRELKVPVYASAIARKLATVHSLNVPIDKEPTWLWDTLNIWLDTVRTPTQEKCSEEWSNPAIESELCSFDFESEMKWLKSFLQSCNSPTVFCHNDLQEGNILLPESSSIKNFDDKIVFIDFEYCAYNYRGFDLGNHFCERMFDYSNPEWPHYYTYFDEYPGDDDKRLFVREYINSRKLTNDRATEDQLIKEADYFALAAHMLWTLWSINNARTSKIQFGYWEHGKSRLMAYKNHKKQVLRKYMTIV